MGMIVSLTWLWTWTGNARSRAILREPQLPASILYPMKGSNFWQADSTCPACMSCGLSFSFFVRRHHCRLCGFIFCASCSARNVPGPEHSYPDQAMVRACLACFAYYRASKVPRSRLTAITTLPTLDEFQRSEAVSAESNLNPAMKLLIDSMDAYDNRAMQRQTQRRMVLSRALSDGHVLLVDIYHGHVRDAVRQLLVRRRLSSHLWLEVIVDFALHCAWQFQPMTSDGTIHEMVNIVGVAQGSARDSAIVHGAVLTGVNVVHRKMATTIADPFIIIIDGALAARIAQSSSLISLRSIPTTSHLQSLIEKVLILCPDLIICRETISLETARVFQDHGISVVCGVSQSDLAMLRRALRVLILDATTLMNSSVDSDHIYGRCGCFSVGRYDVPVPDPGSGSATRSSTFVTLSGGDASLFATLRLHGVRSSEQLRALESVTKTALLMAWSLSLEISYLSDSSATVALDQFDRAATGASVDDAESGSDWSPIPSSPLVSSHVSPAQDASDPALGDGRAATSELIWSLDFGIYWMHKEVSTSQKHVVCFRPRTIRTPFYGAIDSSLGEFLFETCFNVRRHCSCGRSMSDHRCCIVHGNGKLIVEVDNLPQSLLQDQADAIVSWLWCSECRRRSSPVTVLSSRTLRLSLTKYFEICFYDYRSRSRVERCGHRVHRDMIRCFAFDNLIATVQYSMATPFTLSLMQRVKIPHHLSARIARLELSRLTSLTDMARELALRSVARDTPSFVIDSAYDPIRDQIVRDCASIKGAAVHRATDSMGLIAARQLYLPLFRAAQSWSLRLDLEVQRGDPQSSPPRALRKLLSGNAKPAVIAAAWDLPGTFGSRIVPVVRSQISTLIAYALASLPHAAFVMGLRSASDIPLELRQTPLETVLQFSLLGADCDGVADRCEAVLRSVKHGALPTKLSVSVDCGDAGRVWVGFAQQFQALRHCLCDSNYAVIDSLAKSRDWAAKGGKSNASFIRTWDRRLILKRINATEARTLTSLAPDYFEYTADHIFQDRPSALTPILGMFEVTAASTVSKFYVLMPNLLNDPLIDHVFDLKGKASGRLVRKQSAADARHTGHRIQLDSDWTSLNGDDFMDVTGPSAAQVLQDENFALFTQGNPLPLLTDASQVLSDALENDARFLANLGIMDYSVLIGVRTTPPQTLTVGIIDYIRSYTLDKKVETTVKSLLEKDAPTILPPVLYMQRFLDSMQRHFVSVPNRELSNQSMPITALDVDPDDANRLSCSALLTGSVPPQNDTFITRRHSSILNGAPFRSKTFYYKDI